MARAAVSAFACSVGWLSSLVYWFTHSPEIRTVWIAYLDKYFSKPLSHYLEETASDNEMMMRILQGGEQMGILGGQEGKENDGMNAYLGNAGGYGLSGKNPKNMANVVMVTDLKAMLAAQFENESKKHQNKDHDHDEMDVDHEANELSIKVNKALYPDLSNGSQSQPSQQKNITHGGLMIDTGGEGNDHMVGGGGGGGGGGGHYMNNRGQQRVIPLRGSRDTPLAQKNSKRKASKRISMGKLSHSYQKLSHRYQSSLF